MDRTYVLEDCRGKKMLSGADFQEKLEEGFVAIGYFEGDHYVRVPMYQRTAICSLCRNQPRTYWFGLCSECSTNKDWINGIVFAACALANDGAHDENIRAIEDAVKIARKRMTKKGGGSCGE